MYKESKRVMHFEDGLDKVIELEQYREKWSKQRPFRAGNIIMNKQDKAIMRMGFGYRIALIGIISLVVGGILFGTTKMFSIVTDNLESMKQEAINDVDRMNEKMMSTSHGSGINENKN